MRKFLLLALIICLAGCAAAIARYGNFMKNTTQANDRKMADDVTKKLTALYPPALTRFDLQHSTSDFFGTCLVESMRAKGYAILEHKRKPKTDATGVPLSYMVDQLKDSGLYRVTVTINRQQTLDRVYEVAQDGVIYPVGYWVRKE